MAYTEAESRAKEYYERAEITGEEITRRVLNYLRRTYPSRSFDVKKFEENDGDHFSEKALQFYELKPGFFGSLFPRLVARIENYEMEKVRITSFKLDILEQKLLEALVAGNTEKTMPVFFSRWFISFQQI